MDDHIPVTYMLVRQRLFLSCAVQCTNLLCLCVGNLNIFFCSFINSITETHQLAEATEEKNMRMKEALGIKDDYKDGSSFDQELKEAQRKSEQLAWEARQKEMEKEREREQRIQQTQR